MLGEFFRRSGIEYFAAVPVSECRPANRRLYDALPEGCFAVFCLIPYFTRDENKRLAAFARVPDYHLFSRELFSEAEECLKAKYPDAYVRGFADHSPVDERHGAAVAGLGVIGRHGLIINERYSSLVCIGELVCSLTREELVNEGVEVRVGEVKYCEGCDACVRACPGGCADGDKSTCISAISQKKGELTEDDCEALRRSGSIWGCDVCQMSCPHTKRAIESGGVYTDIPFFCEASLAGDEGAVIALSDEDYKKYTFSYRKRNVMDRNIKIVRGERFD